MKLGCLSIAGYVVLIQRVAWATATNSRIINGTFVETASPLHAFFALPTRNAGSDEWLGCGASIISPTFALSSAHCFGGGNQPCTGPKEIALWVGDVEIDADGVVVANDAAKSFRVKAELVCNPAWDGKCSHGNDVALLKLKEALPAWVKPVPLNLRGTAAGNVGDVVTPMGFGLTEESFDNTVISSATSKVLRKVSVTVLAQDSEKCARVYAGGWGCSDPASEAPAQNLDMQVCAGAEAAPDRDACAGDSGSPVVDASGIQVALVSYGGGPGEKMEGPGRMCGDPNYPGVYARVSAFREFITQTVHDLPSDSALVSFADSSDENSWESPIAPHLRR